MIGDGANFVRTMAGLADRGVSPQVVDDQRGRLTFAETIAEAIGHLLQTGADFGVYLARHLVPGRRRTPVLHVVFRLRGRSPVDVRPVSTEDYTRGRSAAPRPANSVLSSEKLNGTGFVPPDALETVGRYVAQDATG